MGKHVGVQHDDDFDDGSQSNRMPHYKSEDRALVPDLLGGSGCNRDRLRVHHFSHHATRTISRAHQNRIDPELLRSNSLQTPKQRVRY